MTVRLAIINSLAYSGTTWINLLLGSHPEALVVGPGRRVYDLTPSQAPDTCFVHGPECSFWPDFIRTYDRRRNFFLQLREYSGRGLFILNNPGAAVMAEAKDHPDIEVLQIKQVRDGRSTLVSMMRHHPGRYSNIYDAVRGWLYPAWTGLDDFVPDNQDSYPLLRYEDVVADWNKALTPIGDFLGIKYDNSVLRYWEYDHHLPTGNVGTIYLLQKLCGLEDRFGQPKPFYDDLAKRVKASPDSFIVDERWRDEFSLNDRIAYDFIAGPLHAGAGYQRDDFNLEDVLTFLDAYDVPFDRQAAISQIPRFSRQNEGRGGWRRFLPARVSGFLNRVTH